MFCFSFTTPCFSKIIIKILKKNKEQIIVWKGILKLWNKLFSKDSIFIQKSTVYVHIFSFVKVYSLCMFVRWL